MCSSNFMAICSTSKDIVVLKVVETWEDPKVEQIDKLILKSSEVT